MKIKKRKDGSITLSAESDDDSDYLYRLLSGGKHSPGWFYTRIGKQVYRGKDEVMVVDEKHAKVLFEMQEEGVAFTDPLLPEVQECDATKET